ncbi:hypothetical protein [Vulcanisaeta sp. JCM 14467]|uniref:hypothetical protein n=1 Tax=Vulcanisaeta sp. JCM 14467 TaxID=1295370 RepID=UPI000A429EC8|nr:hypothetical protein [Vulcanisaeta sp. JCM 14467]
MKPLGRGGVGDLDREVEELILGKRRIREVRVRPINTEEVINRELSKFAKSWASRCAEPLQDYCRNVLMRLSRYFTQDSIASLLNEALSRGLSIEAVVIMLSQCNLIYCDDGLIRNYLDTGRVDINQLLQTLQSQGITMSRRN